MTDLATLEMKIDSTQVRAGVQELDKLTAAGAKSEKAVDGLGKAADDTAKKTKTASDAAAEIAAELQKAAAGGDKASQAFLDMNSSVVKLAGAQAQATRETAQAKAAYKAGEIGLEEYNAEVLRTKTALGLMTAEHRDAVRAFQKTQGAADVANDNLGKLGKGTNAAAFAARNLNYQLVDMAQGFAMGMPPMMILMQQVPQAADAFAMLAKESGGAGSAVLGLAGKFGPVILIVGALAAAVGLVTAEINKNSEVQVTWKDVVLGAYDVVKGYLEGELTAAFKKFGLTSEDVFNSILTVAKWAMNGVIASFVVVPKVINAALQHLPAAFGDAFYSAVNLAIDAFNLLVDASVAPLNGIVNAFNIAFGTKIPGIVIGGVDKIANPYAGGMARLGSAGAAAVVGTFTTDYIGNMASAISGAAVKRHLQGAAEKGGSDIGHTAGKAAGEAFKDEFAQAMEQLGEDVARAFADIAKNAQKTIQDIMSGASSELEGTVGDINSGRQRAWEEEQRIADANRQRTLDTAHQVADIIGGKLGNAVHAMIDAINDALPNLAAELGGKFGKAFEAFSNGAALGGAVGTAVGGSSTGASIGGGLGGAAFKEFAGAGLTKALGAFGGPLASIAGGLIGGLIGGMLKSTPHASATVSIIGGEAMETAISGNKAALKKVAGGMADSIISGLTDLADSLGAQLTGDAKVSIGVRKKNYRVDPTGAGNTKTGKGAVDFGDDQAAAIAFALQDAIKDGVLGGLSASLQALIQGDGDLQTQIEKALSFKGVFDDLAKNDDPGKFAQDDITKWHDSMAKIFAEAGATGDELAELERLTGIKRADAAADAAKAIADAVRPAQELQVQIYTLEGKADLARGLQHEMELQGLNDVERALQIRIYQLESEAELTAKQTAIADERYGLETRMYQLLGDTQKLREREFATVSEANQPLLQHIYALEDLKTETEAATQAAKDAADLAKSITDERLGLETQLLQINGDTVALRAQEIAALDPSNRALQQLVYARQDEIAATNAAAQAASDLAAKQKAIADERYGLETQYLQAIGDEATLRARALAQIDPSNRALQQQIYDEQDRQKLLQDQAAAQAELARQTEAANAAIAEMAGRFTDYAKTIRDFQAGLFADQNGGTYATTLAEFKRTSSMAALGDEASLQSFVGVSQKFLESARNNAGSNTDYRRAIGMVSAAADQAASGADKMAQMAAEQLAYVQTTAVQAQAISETSLDTLAELQVQTKTEESDVIPTLRSMAATMDEMRDEIARLREEARISAAASVSAANRTANTLGSWDAGDHARISNDSDTPVTVTGNITVINPVDSPVNVDQVA